MQNIQGLKYITERNCYPQIEYLMRKFARIMIVSLTNYTNNYLFEMVSCLSIDIPTYIATSVGRKQFSLSGI